MKNIEILLRIYCFQKEIKKKMEKYNKAKLTPTIEFCYLINQEFMQEYKKYFEYETFYKKIKKRKELLECIKDKDGIINHDKLDQNNNLNNIITEFKNAKKDLVESVNNKEAEIKKFKDEYCKIKYCKLGEKKLYCIENFELINQKIYDYLINKFSFEKIGFTCQYLIGEEYIFLHIVLPVCFGIPTISEFVKYKDVNDIKVKYIIDHNHFINDLFYHLQDKGIENLIKAFKTELKNENVYNFGEGKIFFYKYEKDKFKSLKINFADKGKKKEIKAKTHIPIISNVLKINFTKNETLQKITYLYCYYTYMIKNIYENKNKKKNNKIFSKYYLINHSPFLKIKIDLDYKMLKDEFDNNENIKKLIDTSFPNVNNLNIEEIIKLVSQESIQKYKKKEIIIDKNLNIEPNMIPKMLQNQQDNIFIYNDFEIIDKNLLQFFFPKFKELNKIEADCLIHQGKVIINLPTYMNNNKYVTLIGEVDYDTYNFITSFILIYDTDSHQKSHINYILDNNINKYLELIQVIYTPINLNNQTIGTLILNQEGEIPPPKKERPKIGLQNIGATCYMNATLQCFVHIKKFVEYFKNNKQKKDVLSNKKTLSYSFKILIDKLIPDDYTKIKEKVYAPEEFKAKISKMNPLFEGVAANDSKDLINFIVMTLHDELNLANDNITSSNQILNQANKDIMFQIFSKDFIQKYDSLASKLFYGINYNITKCTLCGIPLYNFQVYFFLIFPLEEVRKFIYFNNNNQFNQFNQFNMNNTNMVDIYHCFEYDRKITLMSGDNAMFCNICNKTTNSHICTNLVFGPNILIIILNRGKGKEFDVKLNFSENLDLSNYVEQHSAGVKYNLIGVITHLGESGMGGHFIAFCKDYDNNNWYKFNDAIVSPVNNFKAEVIDFGMPYLLFYQKENLNN